MMDRHRARILAVQSCCQFDVLGESFLSELDGFLAEESPAENVRTYARRLTSETWRRVGEIDTALGAAAEHWDVSRMPLVDRNILRVAVCELWSEGDVPAKVAINEAVELAKEFGSADSGRFVNGILDAIHKARADAGGT